MWCCIIHDYGAIDENVTMEPKTILEIPDDIQQEMDEEDDGDDSEESMHTPVCFSDVISVLEQLMLCKVP